MSMAASSITLLFVALLHSTTAAPSEGSCPDGSYPVNCLVNPCQYASCPGVEGATCVADYCGGCNARWIFKGQEVTDECEGTTCPDGSEPHNCKVDPCEFATCPAFPQRDVVCVADYCGGCNVRWYIKGDFKLEVTTICQGDAGKCPDGSRPVNCFVDPCQFASCPGVPGATCRPDYCGGCNARWYLNDQEVTDTCGLQE